MNNYNTFNLVPWCLALLLTACGGGDGGGSGTSEQGSENPSQSEADFGPQVTDNGHSYESILTVKPSSDLIHVSELISMSDYSQAVITSYNVVEAMGETAADCYSIEISKDGQTLNTELLATGGCQLTVTVEAEPKMEVSGFSAMQSADFSTMNGDVEVLNVETLVVASEEEFSTLPPISLTIAADNPAGAGTYTIDLDAEPPTLYCSIGCLNTAWLGVAVSYHFPTNYQLAATGLTIQGQGSAASDSGTTQIMFEPVSNQTGYSRITYLIEDGSSNTRVGTVDVTVTDSANHSPEVTSFCYPVHSTGDPHPPGCPPLIKEGIGGDMVRLGETITINIDDFYNDQDEDPGTITAVQSATAEVTLDGENLTDTQFKFTANQSGQHYVTYSVIDGQGGYDSGMVTVNVGEPMFVQVEAYFDAMLALDKQGDVYFWGQAQRSNSGLPRANDDEVNINHAWVYNSWTKVPGISNIVQIATTNNGNALALDRKNQLWVLGQNTSGELGIGTYNSDGNSPVEFWQRWSNDKHRTSTDWSDTSVANTSQAHYFNNELRTVLPGTSYTYKHIERIVSGFNSFYVLIAVENLNNGAKPDTVIAFTSGSGTLGGANTGLLDGTANWEYVPFVDINHSDLDDINFYSNILAISQYRVVDITASNNHALAVLEYDDGADSEPLKYSVFAVGEATQGALGFAKTDTYCTTHCVDQTIGNGENAETVDVLERFHPVFDIPVDKFGARQSASVATGFATDGGGVRYSSSYILSADGRVWRTGSNHQGQLFTGQTGSVASEGTDVCDDDQLDEFTEFNPALLNDDNDEPISNGKIAQLKARGWFVYVTTQDGLTLGAGNNSNLQVGLAGQGDICGLTPIFDSTTYPEHPPIDLLAPGWRHGLIGSSVTNQYFAMGTARYTSDTIDEQGDGKKVDFRSSIPLTEVQPFTKQLSICPDEATYKKDAACVLLHDLRNSEEKGLIITAPLTYSALLNMGYITDGDQDEDNQGRTFSHYFLNGKETTTYGAGSGEGGSDGYNDYRVSIRQDGMGLDEVGELRYADEHSGVFGQLDRLCKDLASRHFYGKDDWRRPEWQELYDAGIHNNTAGFDSVGVWTSDVDSNDSTQLRVYNPNQYSSPSVVYDEISSGYRGVCVSETK